MTICDLFIDRQISFLKIRTGISIRDFVLRAVIDSCSGISWRIEVP